MDISLNTFPESSLPVAIKKIWLLQQTSYSSSLVLHSCPRKYQLDKLRAERKLQQRKMRLGVFTLHLVMQSGVGFKLRFFPMQVSRNVIGQRISHGTSRC